MQGASLNRTLTLTKVKRSFIQMPIMSSINMVELLAQTESRAESAASESELALTIEAAANFSRGNPRNARTQKNSIEVVGPRRVDASA